MPKILNLDEDEQFADAFEIEISWGESTYKLYRDGTKSIYPNHSNKPRGKVAERIARNREEASKKPLI